MIAWAFAVFLSRSSFCQSVKRIRQNNTTNEQQQQPAVTPTSAQSTDSDNNNLVTQTSIEFTRAPKRNKSKPILKFRKRLCILCMRTYTRHHFDPFTLAARFATFCRSTVEWVRAREVACVRYNNNTKQCANSVACRVFIHISRLFNLLATTAHVISEQTKA